MQQNTFSLFNHEVFDVTMCQFGYETCQPNHVFGPAIRKHFLFHYIISGKGVLISSSVSDINQTFNLEGGQGFMIWPDQNATYIADNKDPWVYAWVGLDGIGAKDMVMQAGLLQDSPIYNAKSIEAQEKMKHHLLQIIENQTNPPLELMGYFLLFLSALIESSEKKRTKGGGTIQDFYLREAISYIEKNYDRDISINNIAYYTNLHRSYLSRIFNIVLGITPQRFLLDYRMKKACQYLKSDAYSISEIGQLVGYSNPLNFSRAFKREVGVSPRKYRTENLLNS